MGGTATGAGVGVAGFAATAAGAGDAGAAAEAPGAAGAGVPAARIHVERFTSLPSGETHRPAAQHPIRFLRSKREVLPAPGQTVLDAGLDAGLPLRFSCTLGGCASCRVKLVRGTVQMDEPNCLAKSEIDAGYILACIACPTSPIEVEA